MMETMKVSVMFCDIQAKFATLMAIKKPDCYLWFCFKTHVMAVMGTVTVLIDILIAVMVSVMSLVDTLRSLIDIC